jgi:cytochrome c
MRHGARRFAVLVLAAVLAGCGGQEQGEETATPAAPASPTNAPPVAFAQCRSCHSMEAGRNMIGPSLHGIVGKPAASVAGYTYSNALKASGLTWDAATLDAWLASPAKLVPGNKMIFAGQHDAARRKEVIDYMAAQK